MSRLLVTRPVAAWRTLRCHATQVARACLRAAALLLCALTAVAPLVSRAATTCSAMATRASSDHHAPQSTHERATHSEEGGDTSASVCEHSMMCQATMNLVAATVPDETLQFSEGRIPLIVQFHRSPVPALEPPPPRLRV